MCLLLLCVGSIVEHWQSATSPTPADTVTECHIDTVDTDVDMSEVRAENERKLAAMTEEEIIARQKELLSALGQLTFSSSHVPSILSPNNKWPSKQVAIIQEKLVSFV